MSAWNPYPPGPPPPMYPPPMYPPPGYPPGQWPGTGGVVLPAPPVLRGIGAGVIDAATGLVVLGAWVTAARFLARAYHLPVPVALGVPGVLVAFACVFQFLFSASLGEMAMGLKVRALDGRVPGRGRLFLRCLITSSPLWVGPGLILLEQAIGVRTGLSWKFTQTLVRPIERAIWGGPSWQFSSNPVVTYVFAAIYALNVGLLPAILLFLGSLLGLGPGRLTLHDMISGTRVLRRGVGEAGRGFVPIVQPHPGPPGGY